ncbi:MAG: thioredoxin family protein [Kiritimatiellia bacterium]
MKFGQIAVWAIAVVLVVVLAAFFLLGRQPPPPPPPAPAPAAAESPAESPAPAYKAAIAGAVPGEWTMDLDAAKALAAETGLPLFLNFTGSDWCGWCRLMDKQVFSQAAWQAYAKEHFILVWLDFPQDKTLVPEAFAARNQQLLQEFEIGGFPTFVLLDADGQTRLGQTGAARDVTPERFIAALDDILRASDKAIAALKEKLTDEQNAALDEAKADRDLARQKLADWVQTQPEPSEENNALYESMLDEIQRAEAAFMDLLKAAP